MDASEAKGPTYGRYLGSTLLRKTELDPEVDFCMQIDSHMDFVDHYDTELMDVWSSTEVCCVLYFLFVVAIHVFFVLRMSTVF